MIWRKLQVYLTKDDMQLYDDFQAIAKEQNVSTSEFIKNLMKKYVYERNPAPRFTRIEIDGKLYQGILQEIKKKEEES